jgi:hypothetical protein
MMPGLISRPYETSEKLPLGFQWRKLTHPGFNPVEVLHDLVQAHDAKLFSHAERNIKKNIRWVFSMTQMNASRP